jgi:hypothetical protein
MDMGEAIEVQRVVGFGHTQAVVTNTLFFMRDCKIVTASAVQSIRKTVLVDRCRVLFDKVLITGRLRKEISFREAATRPGNVAPVGSALAEERFEAIVDVKGARPGDTCVVIKAFVEGEEEKPLTQAPCGGIKGLVESSVLFLCVKVLRPVILVSHDSSGTCSDSLSEDENWSHDSAEDDSESDGSGAEGSSHGWSAEDCHCKGCPQRKTTGLVAWENGEVPDAHPGPVPGSFVGPTIQFPGIF